MSLDPYVTCFQFFCLALGICSGSQILRYHQFHTSLYTLLSFRNTEPFYFLGIFYYFTNVNYTKLKLIKDVLIIGEIHSCVELCGCFFVHLPGSFIKFI